LQRLSKSYVQTHVWILFFLMIYDFCIGYQEISAGSLIREPFILRWNRLCLCVQSSPKRNIRHRLGMNGSLWQEFSSCSFFWSHYKLKKSLYFPKLRQYPKNMETRKKIWYRWKKHIFFLVGVWILILEMIFLRNVGRIRHVRQKDYF